MPALGQDNWDFDLAQQVVTSTGASSDRFAEVMTTGDLNGDGLDDLVFASPGASSGVGEVRVVFGSVGGGTTTESIARWTLRDTANGDETGHSLLVADINGDGDDDLLVGSPFVGSSNRGEVWIFEGPLGTGSPSTLRTRSDADRIVIGASGDRIGDALSIGDISSTKWLYIGASRASAGAGKVYAIKTSAIGSGTTTLSAASADVVEWTGSGGERLGRAVTAFATGVAIGAPGAPSGSSPGKVYLVRSMGYLDGTIAGRADATVAGTSGYQQLGWHIANLGTAGGHLSEVLGVSAEEGVEETVFIHNAAIATGTYDVDDYATLGSSDSSSSNHGQPRFVLPASDYDGDGASDFFYADADVNGTSATDTGAVYLLPGDSAWTSASTAAGTGVAVWAMHNDAGAPSEAFGSQMATGDFNGDGHLDLAATTRLFSGPDVPTIRFYYGPFRPGTGGVAGWNDLEAIVEGSDADATTGIQVDAIGDVNCDGVQDAAITAPGAMTATGPDTFAGEAYLYFGPTWAAGELDWQGTVNDAWINADTVMRGVNDGDYLRAVHGLGDIDGDGCDDVLVQAQKVDNGATPDVGAAYLFYGRSNFSPAMSVSAADATFLHNAAGSAFGREAATIEDLDGDGYDELAISSVWDSTSSTDTGTVYLFRLSSSRFSGIITPRSDASCIIDGADPGGWLGASLLGFDLHGTGSQDLVVGAPQDDSGPSDTEGKVYAWVGWPCPSGQTTTTSASADIVIEGQFTNAGFGYALAPVGPFDDDGTEVMGLAVSAPYEGASTGNTAPRVSVVPAGQPLGTHTTPSGGFDICGGHAGGHFGFALSSGNQTWRVDDTAGVEPLWDTDGALELYVGAPLEGPPLAPQEGVPTSYRPRGRAYAFEGHALTDLLGVSGCAVDASLNSDFWWRVDATEDYAGLGFSLTSGLDLNRDGHDDVLIGQPGKDNGSEADAGSVSISLSGQDVP